MRNKITAEKYAELQQKEFPKAFEMAQELLAAMIPGVEVKFINDKSCDPCVTAFDVCIDPVVVDCPRIGAIDETLGWQVNVNCEGDLTEVGKPTLSMREAVCLFAETVFKYKVGEYFQKKDDDDLAKEFESGAPY